MENTREEKKKKNSKRRMDPEVWGGELERSVFVIDAGEKNPISPV